MQFYLKNNKKFIKLINIIKSINNYFSMLSLSFTISLIVFPFPISKFILNNSFAFGCKSRVFS